MSTFHRFLPILFVFAVGCGGSSPTLSGSRGDGSIPVGRAKGRTLTPLEVAVVASDGSTHTTQTVQGEVYLPALPAGSARFSFEPLDRSSAPKFIDILVTNNQEQIFDVDLAARGESAQITRVWFANSNPLVLRVGSNAKLFFRYEGTGVQGTAPSYWIEGGVGSLNPGGVFRAVTPGSGKVYGDFFGMTTSLDIVVTE